MIVAVGKAFTVIVIVLLVAHVGAAVDVGVNVYVVVTVLFKAGDQDPEILLFDVVGNALNVPPEQIAATCVNVGVVNGFTVIDIVVVVAHEGDAVDVGVKVYVVVTVLFKAGDQDPEIPLFDVVSNALKVPPEQIAGTCVNVGVVDGFTVTEVVVEVAEQLFVFVTTTV